MKSFLNAGKFLALDMASTIVLLVVLQLTHNIMLGVGIGIAIAFGQVGYYLVRRQPVHTMLWLSLVLVSASGAATFLTNDPRFVMLKPSVISVVVGLVMLKRGWMDRYLPAIALEVVPDLAVFFGYVWAANMFVSAVLNIVLALTLSPVAWATAMSIYHTGSTIGLFLIQYASMRIIGVRRRQAAVPLRVGAQA
ncbi:MAG: inner membrane-spanning protein YciB [Caulobacterales bacterium]